ncbi:DUF4876 domain-containing protein [uncultured Draconibacterium sp.]|uniref:DUF4876 domain-containing protein n=1 Tax=uncultured Draconibacterium sp. TaxID=1573823 RepID=UPI0029C968A3|nr:DUF4876 domain-containing protein [uncultured Draconibacterium sp.]
MRNLFVLILVFFTACEIYDEPSTYLFEVSAYYPATINNGDPISNQLIIVKDQQTGREYKAQTNDIGQAVFNVRGGNYDISISFVEEHVIDISGYPNERDLIIFGNTTNELITEDNLSITLNTEYSIKNEGFVIKELYTSGSLTPDGAHYNIDKFVEIYNNTDQILYSDGLCFGVVINTVSYRPTPWVDDNGNLLPRTPIWSFVAIVPGSGEEHPVQPGQSIIIALVGINHRDDPNGNPNSIDLSFADWEMIVDGGKYVDTPVVPNILMQRISKGTAIAIDNQGQPVIIFRLPTNNLEAIFTNPDNYMVQPGGSFNCFMVPTEWVIDGVDNLRLDDRGAYKRLPGILDAGYIQHKAGHSAVSIRRKVKEVVNGRTIYMDTNNSSNDFLTNQIPSPGVIATQ